MRVLFLCALVAGAVAICTDGGFDDTFVCLADRWRNVGVGDDGDTTSVTDQAGYDAACCVDVTDPATLTCTTDEFIAAATGTTDNVCAACDICEVDEHDAGTPCTGVGASDTTTCTSNTDPATLTCTAAQFIAAFTATTDNVCADCDVCEVDEHDAGTPCNGLGASDTTTCTSNTGAVALSCTAAQFVEAATATTNNVCADCDVCEVDEHDAGTPCNGLGASDTTACTSNTDISGTCEVTEFEAPATATSDATCTTITDAGTLSCTAAQFIAATTTTTDNVCADCAGCSGSQHDTAPCDGLGASDTTTCVDNADIVAGGCTALQFFTAATTTTDNLCTDCDVCTDGQYNAGTACAGDVDSVEDSMDCQACPTGCTTCTAADACDACDDTHELNDTTGVCDEVVAAPGTTTTDDDPAFLTGLGVAGLLAFM